VAQVGHLESLWLWQLRAQYHLRAQYCLRAHYCPWAGGWDCTDTIRLDENDKEPIHLHINQITHVDDLNKARVQMN
jgi:hypothetical protein